MTAYPSSPSSSATNYMRDITADLVGYIEAALLSLEDAEVRSDNDAILADAELQLAFALEHGRQCHARLVRCAQVFSRLTIEPAPLDTTYIAAITNLPNHQELIHA